MAIAAACATGAAVAVAFALLSQAGGDEVALERPPEAPGSAEVRAAIEDAAKTRNADDCARLATPRYLRQYERRHVSALAACQKGVFERDRGLLASDVGVEVVEVENERALALVTYRAGGQAGITARLPLVRDEKDRLVLDRIPFFERATRRQLNRALRGEVASGPVTFGGRAARCAVRKTRKLSDREFERLLLSGSAAELFTLVAECDPRGFAEVVVEELREAGSPIKSAQQACYARDLADSSTRTLVEILVAIEEKGNLGVALECRSGR